MLCSVEGVCGGSAVTCFYENDDDDYGFDSCDLGCGCHQPGPGCDDQCGKVEDCTGVCVQEESAQIIKHIKT